MPVRIRLARPPGATKLTTHYHIVVVDARKRRDANPLEILGIYDPRIRPRVDRAGGWTVDDAMKTIAGTDALPAPDKRIEWSVDRLRYWVGVGAEPTKTIVHLLDYVSPLHPFPKPTFQDSTMELIGNSFLGWTDKRGSEVS